MKKYSNEFKAEALNLSDEIGVKKTASQLGLQYYTLAEWRKNRKAAKKNLTRLRIQSGVPESVSLNGNVTSFARQMIY